MPPAAYEIPDSVYVVNGWDLDGGRSAAYGMDAALLYPDMAESLTRDGYAGATPAEVIDGDIPTLVAVSMERLAAGVREWYGLRAAHLRSEAARLDAVAAAEWGAPT